MLQDVTLHIIYFHVVLTLVTSLKASDMFLTTSFFTSRAVSTQLFFLSCYLNGRIICGKDSPPEAIKQVVFVVKITLE